MTCEHYQYLTCVYWPTLSFSFQNVPAHAADVVARSLMCVFSAAERLEDLVALCVDVEVGGTLHVRC